MATSFDHVETRLACFSSREAKEILMQWNLDKNIVVEKFRFSGAFNLSDGSEYDRLISDFLKTSQCTSLLGMSGVVAEPYSIATDQLNTTVMSMDFFDRLTESGMILSNGGIRGCFDDTFDGITISDQLREFLVNENSENASALSEIEKREFIFCVFKLFVIGGAMCQPDTSIDRYSPNLLNYQFIINYNSTILYILPDI